MMDSLTQCEQVRFRTEKSLYFSGFADILMSGGTAIPTLSTSNKRTYGLVC